MAQLFGSAILSACLGLEGSYYDACSKAIDAGTRQIGLYQQAELIEKRTNKYALGEAKKYFGDEGVKAIGFIGFGVKTVRDEKVAFKLPNLGLASSVNNEIGKDSYKINIQWNF
jgi:hypothetical protein